MLGSDAQTPYLLGGQQPIAVIRAEHPQLGAVLTCGHQHLPSAGTGYIILALIRACHGPSALSQQAQRPCQAGSSGASSEVPNGHPGRGQNEYAGAVMSIAISLRQWAVMVTRYHFAYLLTVGDDERAHVVAVHPTLANDTLAVEDPGRKTSANLAAHPLVTLVWPPTDPSD